MHATIRIDLAPRPVLSFPPYWPTRSQSSPPLKSGSQDAIQHNALVITVWLDARHGPCVRFAPKEVSDNQQTYPSSKANHSHCPLSIAVLTF
jgi:hypothetical protein